MTNTCLLRARAILSAGISCLALSSSSPAQTAPARPPESEAVKLEAFTVTGSNIRRTEIETALPVTVIDRDDLDLRGVSTPADLFDTITMANPPTLTELESAGQSARGDNTAVDLRGLGSGSTLVLVNGRRMPPHPISQSENGVPALSTNINTVPNALAARIELLRDGASAIYGSDAAAGVINYIVTPRFEGNHTTARVATTQDGGGNEFRFTHSWGKNRLNGDKTRLAVGFDYLHRDALVPADRWWAKDADQRRTRKLPAPWDGVPVRLANGTLAAADNDFDNRSGTNPYGTYQRGTVNADGSVAGSRPANNAGIVTTQPDKAMTLSTAGQFFLSPLADGTTGFRNTTPSRNLDSPERDFYQNLNNGSIILPRTDRFNLGITADHKLKGELTAFGDFYLYHARSATGRVGAQIDAADAPGIVTGVDNPYNPFGSRFYHPTGASNPDGTIRLTGTPTTTVLSLVRPNDFTTRVIRVRSDSFRATAGLRGKLGRNWEWEGGLSYGMANTHDVENNNIRESKLRESLLKSDPAQAFNPFGYTFKIDPATRLIVIDKPYSNPAALLDSMKGVYSREAWTGLGLIDFKISGNLWRMFGNEIGVASGVEARYESYKFRMPPYAGLNPPGDPNPFLRPNDNDFILLSPNKDADAHRWIYSAYAETILPFITPRNDVPLARALELQLAGRIEHFPFFGNAIKPKASMGYTPVRWLKFRGSVNESFKAPNIIQTSNPRRQVFASSITDPYRFDVTRLLTDGSTGRTVFRQGSRDLKPEETVNYTAGFVLDVPGVKGLAVTVDFYKANQNNVITSADGAYQLRRDRDILDVETQRQLGAGTPIDRIDLGSGTTAYKGNSKVTRAPLTPGDAALYAAYNATVPRSSQRAPVGPVINMIEDFVNLAGRDIEGIEYGLEYRIPKVGDLGDLAFRGEASYRHKYTVQDDPGAALNDNLYEDGLAKWRFNLSARWRRANWNAGWFMNYYGKFVDTGAATTEAIYNALGQPDYINPFNNNGAVRYVLEIKPAIAHNVNLGYRFDHNSRFAVLRGLSVRGGVNNVFNVAPPVSDSTLAYESGTVNPRGRQYWLELSRAW